jgi:hypothetical protein
LQDREWIECGAFDTQAANRFRGIGETAEGPVDAASSESDALRERREFVLQTLDGSCGNETLAVRLACFGLRVSSDQRQQLVIFERCKSLVVHFRRLKGYNDARKTTNASSK